VLVDIPKDVTGRVGLRLRVPATILAALENLSVKGHMGQIKRGRQLAAVAERPMNLSPLPG